MTKKEAALIDSLYAIIAKREQTIEDLKKQLAASAGDFIPEEYKQYVAVEIFDSSPIVFPDYTKVDFHIDPKRHITAYLETDKEWKRGSLNINAGSKELVVWPHATNWIQVTVEDR